MVDGGPEDTDDWMSGGPKDTDDWMSSGGYGALFGAPIGASVCWSMISKKIPYYYSGWRKIGGLQMPVDYFRCSTICLLFVGGTTKFNDLVILSLRDAR
uniref:Uncharacterized protein n=1 Tax=Arundo donax TaxID=35708 RepID=A0A0A8ZUE1_ARUDO